MPLRQAIQWRIQPLRSPAATPFITPTTGSVGSNRSVNAASPRTPRQDLDETVRTPIDAKEARKVLEHLKNWSGKASSQWKARANAHQSTIESGDPFGYAEVYKGLAKLEREGTLRASDRVHLKHSLDFLAEEMAFALGKSPEQTRQQITKAGSNK